VSSGSALAPAQRGRQVLGFWSLLALGINGIVGVGIFFAPAELARLVPGSASALAFALTALLLLPVAWSYGRLGSAYPEDGGPYVWAREALGQRFAFGVGFVAYASAVLSTAAVVSGLGLYLAPVLGAESPLERMLFRVGAALLFSGLALCGLRPSAWIWSALTLVKLLPLLLLALLGALAFAAPAQVEPLPAFAPGDLARAALLAVFPLQGFEIVPVPAGEVRGGPRTVLLATLLALGFSALLYVLLQLACVRAMPNLAEIAAPVVAAGSHYTHGAGTAWFAAGTNLSAIGIAFGMFAMTPRYLAALGTEAQLGPALARERRGVPVLALGVTTACVALLVSSSSLERLFVLSSLAVLTQYAVTALCLLRLARRRTRGLGLIDEWLAPLTLVSIAALAHAAKAVELAILAGLLLLGFGLQALRHALASRKAAR
jgi:APA family basic amino acid/polyamine antiporter